MLRSGLGQLDDGRRDGERGERSQRQPARHGYFAGLGAGLAQNPPNR